MGKKTDAERNTSKLEMHTKIGNQGGVRQTSQLALACPLSTPA